MFVDTRWLSQGKSMGGYVQGQLLGLSEAVKHAATLPGGNTSYLQVLREMDPELKRVFVFTNFNFALPPSNFNGQYDLQQTHKQSCERTDEWACQDERADGRTDERTPQ